ncbi:hypothetical protein OS493_011489 [Desmophyllum pertusum]|uniref:Uncharacterized protein n=1 Tax=Desmophyllum pertusum TaxID=174260 RepID=A0A9W9YQQ2_9CNID|nr:hypothetical protein OS493_011489 [Desmophyllum pertusum]
MAEKVQMLKKALDDEKATTSMLRADMKKRSIDLPKEDEGGNGMRELVKEEINSPELIADLAERDADAPIFGKLGFTYGKAARGGRSRPYSPAPSKPTMAELSIFTPEMKQLYLSKRKKIGILATSRWGNSCPKFNSPDTKTELKEFSAEIAPECAIPEINFNEEALQIILRRFSVSRNNTKRTKAHLARMPLYTFYVCWRQRQLDADNADTGMLSYSKLRPACATIRRSAMGAGFSARLARAIASPSRPSAHTNATNTLTGTQSGSGHGRRFNERDQNPPSNSSSKTRIDATGTGLGTGVGSGSIVPVDPPTSSSLTCTNATGTAAVTGVGSGSGQHSLL